MSHNKSIITPEIPPREETPSVHAFIGICIAIYFPIRLTANKAQIPCNAVKSSAVKNLFDLKYTIKITMRYVANNTPRRILPESIFAS